MGLGFTVVFEFLFYFFFGETEVFEFLIEYVRFLWRSFESELIKTDLKSIVDQIATHPTFFLFEFCNAA